MRTLIGLFEDSDDANETIADLRKLGAETKDISVVAPEGTSQLATGLQLSPLDVPGLGRVAACGPMTSYLSQATAEHAPDATIGALVLMGVPEIEAKRYVAGIRDGHTLETVVIDDDKADDALEIMREHAVGERTLHAHDGQRGVSDENGDAVLPVIVEELDGVPHISLAQVIQEIVVRNNADPRLETVGGATVRREVDVEPFDPSDYREHYETNYATLSQALGLGDFASYELAYKFGSEMRMDRRFAGERWSTIEPNAKKSWEARNPGTWNHFQEAVKHAWERAKDR